MTDTPPKARRGCLFYTLIASSVIFLLLIAGLLVGMFYAKRMVTNFTDAQPRPLPAVQVSPAEFDQLQARIDSFRKAVRGGTATEPLVLSAPDINALISQDEDFKALKGKVHVTIDGSQVKGQLSVPMDQLNLPIFRGRYLNADAIFQVSVNNGLLRLTAQDIQVKGKPVPDVYMETIRKQNLVRDLNNEPRASAALDRIEKVEVKDGKLIVYPKTSTQ